MTRTSRRGFTLVELLVVIGIIAVLISILLPTINKARRAAKTTAGLSNLRQIGTGLRLYASTNRDSLPYGYTEYYNAARTGLVDFAGWFDQVNQIFNPSAGGTYLTTPRSRYSKVFRDPGEILDAFSVSYAVHARAMPNMEYIRRFTGNDVRDTNAEYKRALGKFKPYRFSEVKTDDALVMDSTQQPGGGWLNDSFYVLSNIDGGRGFSGYYYIGSPDEDAAADQFWYEVGDLYPTDIENGYRYAIHPGPNRDEFGPPTVGDVPAQGNPRWRQRRPDTTLQAATDDAPQKWALGAANVLFGDGHCETVASRDFKRKLLMLQKP